MSSVVDSWNSVTVWTADGTLHPEADYGTALVKRFEEIGMRVTKRYLPDITGDEPLGDDLNVLSGGSTSVSNKTTWMPAAFKLVSRMIEDAREGYSHLLGVCLGSQIIAEHLSAGAVVAGERIYAGLTEVQWGVKDTSVLPSFHYEMVDRTVLERTTQPLNVIGFNDVVSVLAYTSGPRIGATQLHPELTLGDVAAFIDYNAQVIASNEGSVEGSKQLFDKLSPRWKNTAFRDTVERLFSQA